MSALPVVKSETGPDGMKGIHEAGLVAAIVTAIKEQLAERRALRAEIALLQARERYPGAFLGTRQLSDSSDSFRGPIAQKWELIPFK